MKYTAVSVRQLDNRKGKPWQARAKYKDVYGKWKEVSKMLPDAKGKRDAQRIAKEWLDTLNAEADLMPNAGKASTVDKTYREYLKHQLDTGEIEKSTYSNSLHSYNKYIKPYLGDYMFATIDNTVINSWLTKLYQLGLSQNTIHTTYARLKKVYNYFYNNGELLKDPFKGVKMPKKGDTKVTHLTNEQMDNVLESVYLDYEPQDPMYVGILLAFYAGLRRGEICGLRWNDIDFYKHTIRIRSAVGVSNIQGLKDYTKNPKNKINIQNKRSTECVYDMLSMLLKARSFNADGYKVGQKIKFLMADGDDVKMETLIYRGKKNFEMENTGITYRCLVFSFVEYKNKQEKEVITFYVTDDKNHLPVRLDMYLNFGSAKAFLNGFKGIRNPMTSIIKK